jgi:hypothetical protein
LIDRFADEITLGTVHRDIAWPSMVDLSLKIKDLSSLLSTESLDFIDMYIVVEHLVHEKM